MNCWTAQLFFCDPDYATDVRGSRYLQLDKTILSQLYRTARERLAEQAADIRLLLNPQMRLVMETGADRRRENLPTSNEIAIVLPDEFAEASGRDILLAVRNPTRAEPLLSQIDVTHAAYMPLHYVLLFPHGQPGWHYGLRLRNGQQTRQRTLLEQRPYYRIRLHVRNGEYPTLHRSGRLFQQYIVDAFAACEQVTSYISHVTNTSNPMMSSYG